MLLEQPVGPGEMHDAVNNERDHTQNGRRNRANQQETVEVIVPSSFKQRIGRQDAKAHQVDRNSGWQDSIGQLATSSDYANNT